jgi:hypothetical protein
MYTWPMYILDKVINLGISVTGGAVAGVIASVILLRVFKIESYTKIMSAMIGSFKIK